MKFVVCHEPGEGSRYTVESTHPSFDIDALHPHQVLVKILSSSLGFADILKSRGKHQNPIPFPHVLGMDMVGTVIKAHLNVTHLRPGDKVFGGVITGGFATHGVCDARVVHKVPQPLLDNPSFDVKHLAGFSGAFGTAFHALVNIAQIRQREVVLILGATGAVGTAAVTLAKKLGAVVIACGGSDSKLDACKDLGADFTINYTVNPDLTSKLNGLGFHSKIDVIFDNIGGNRSLQAFDSLGPRGRLLVVGFASGGTVPKDAIPVLSLGKVQKAERKVLGVSAGGYMRDTPMRWGNDLKMMLSWLNKGEINIVVHETEYRLNNVQELVRDMVERRVTGKVVVFCEEESKL